MLPLPVCGAVLCGGVVRGAVLCLAVVCKAVVCGGALLCRAVLWRVWRVRPFHQYRPVRDVWPAELATFGTHQKPQYTQHLKKKGAS